MKSVLQLKYQEFEYFSDNKQENCNFIGNAIYILCSFSRIRQDISSALPYLYCSIGKLGVF